MSNEHNNAPAVPMSESQRADMICAVAAICTGTSSRTVAATAIEWVERYYGITTPAAPSQPAVPQGEPVAWMFTDPPMMGGRTEFRTDPENVTPYWTPLYIATPAKEPVTDELLEALRECVNSIWVIDSHVVDFDCTVRFGPYYDFSGLDGIDRHEFLAEHSCVVWPSGGKWSAYCTYEGATWFELFDSADAAKEKCMRLLDRVMPTHPAMKARAIIAALRAKGGK